MGTPTTQNNRNTTKYSAGILPYSIHNGTVHFLLGKDTREDCWADFGGKAETSDQNNIHMTACREFYEETCGSILSYDNILYKLINNNETDKVIKSTTLSGLPYYMYLVHIPYVNYKHTFYKIHSLLNYIDFKKAKYFEKNDLRWIEKSVLLSSNDNTSLKLRHVFKKTIQLGNDIINNIHAEKHNNEIQSIY